MLFQAATVLLGALPGDSDLPLLPV